MTTIGRRGLLASTLVAALAGCGSAASNQPTPSPSEATGFPTPADGQTLRALGLEHGPFLTVPKNITPTRTIDQPNVVTLLVKPDDGRRMLEHLTANLPRQGWQITSSGGSSLIFTQRHWEGAFTLSSELAGLTLRRTNQ